MDIVNDLLAPYGLPEDRKSLRMIRLTREGVSYADFENITSESVFTMDQWVTFLHISERTLQRYKKDNKSFESLQSEKILELLLLQEYGQKVFEQAESFKIWLNSTSLALGGIAPISLLDSSFGIQMVKDELGRIEHGIFV